MFLYIIRLLVFTLFVFISIPSFAKLNVDEVLENIENIQNSNPNKYVKDLKNLTKNRTQFNQNQKDYFDYLTYNQQGFNGDFNLALKNLNALFLRSTSKEIKFRCKVKIANIHIIAGRFTDSLKSLDFVLGQIDSIDNKKLKLLGYKIATVVYSLIEESDLSIKFSNLILQNTSHTDNKCFAQTNILETELKNQIGFSASLNSRINETLSLCEKENDFVHSGLLKTRYLKYKLNLKKSNQHSYNSILNELKSYEKKINDTHYKNLINIKNSLFASIYWKLNEKEKSIFYALKTVKESQSIGDTDQKISALNILVEYYKGVNDYLNSFKYLNLKNNAENLYFKQQQAKFMAYQTVKHKNLANTYQIKVLNQKNKLLELEKIVADKSKTNQMLLIMLLATLLLFFLVLIYRIKRQQQRFKKLSELDHMTMVYNRKGIRDYMDYLLPYSKKKNETIAYAIFDLDLFKKVNDEYGHIIGDWVIKEAIKACQQLESSKAIFARIGGEEFSITMRDSSVSEMKDFAELCRKAISNIKTKEETGHDFHITASFGVTSSNISGFEYQNLMHQADTALYISKDNGRNLVSVYK